MALPIKNLKALKVSQKRDLLEEIKSLIEKYEKIKPEDSIEII